VLSVGKSIIIIELIHRVDRRRTTLSTNYYYVYAIIDEEGIEEILLHMSLSPLE